MHAKIFTLLVLLLTAGCSSVPSVLYKIDVQQGNVITQEMVDKLKPGMTRSQVRFVLGSALIGDVFHNNRWDYVYRLEQHGMLIEQYKLTVFFEDDKLVQTEGDFSGPFASVSPQLVTPTKFAIEEERDATLSPEPTMPSAEQDVPTILAIEEKHDAALLPEPTVPSAEQVLPPPPPGIADGIEAD